MPDTPKGSGAFLTLSNVFDVYAQARVKNSKAIDKHHIQKELEITLHNSKATSVQLRVIQEVYGKWRMISESEKSTRPQADTVQWLTTIPTGTDKVIRATLVFVR